MRAGSTRGKRACCERYFAGVTTVLLASAGAGRELVALSSRGLRVSAFECSQALVEEGQQRLARLGVAAPLVLSAPDEVPVLGTFDAAIVGWGAYTHIVGSPARVAFLRGLRAQVVAGGPILVSFRARREDSRRGRLIAAFGTALRRLRGRPEPVEIGDTLRGQFCHYVARAEVEREFRQAGLGLAFYGDEPYGHAIGVVTPQHRE